MSDDASGGNETPTITAAEKTLNKLFRARQLQKIFNVVAVIAIGLSLASAGQLYRVTRDNHHQSVQLNQVVTELKNDVINSCQSGNVTRTGAVKVWSFFIDLLVSTPVSAEVKADVKIVQEAADAAFPKPQADAIIDLTNRLTGLTKDPRQPAEVALIKSYVAGVYKQLDCRQVYKTSASPPAAPNG